MSSRWSQLPADLLLLVFSKLTVVDIIRSAAVCAAWLSAVDKFRNNRLSLGCRQSPWLLLFSRCSGDDDTCFYDILEKKVYTFRHTDLPIGDERQLVGSSHGWLFAVDSCAKLQMLNPITGRRIDLPSVETSVHVEAVLDEDGCTVGYDVRDNCYGSYDITWEIYDTKAVLSSDPLDGDYKVVGFHNHRLSFLRAEDERWTTLESPVLYRDAIFHKGQLCTVNSNSQLEVWDISQPRPIAKQIIPTPPLLVNGYHYFSYLVETPRGDLLHVKKAIYCIVNDKPYLYKPHFVGVFKVDINACSQVQIHRLEEYVVFLGTNSAFCLPSEEFFAQRKSKLSIYFADDCLEWNSNCKSYGRKVRVYKWEDGRFSYINLCINSRRYSVPPIWITTSLLSG